MITVQQILLIAYCALLTFGPLTLYVCWLASINRRSRPTVIPAVWDFAALLMGLLGFLVVGCMLTTSLISTETYYLQRANFVDFRKAWQANWFNWTLYSLFYLGFFGGLMAISFFRKRRCLSVYQVDQEDVERAVEASLSRNGLPATRVGRSWADGVILVRYFHSTCHADIAIRTAQPLRGELERVIRTELEKSQSSENGVGAWLTSLAFGGTVINTVILGVIMFMKFFR